MRKTPRLGVGPVNAGHVARSLGGEKRLLPHAGPDAQDRATRRAQERDKRDRARRIRTLALRTAAALADQDPTIAGFSIITPNGAVEYLDAELLRRGGRA